MIALIDMLATGVRDDSDNPLAGGAAVIYRAGTTTLLEIFQEREQENPHPNPVPLDSGGRAFVWAQDRVKVVLLDAEGNTVRTIDDVGISDSDLASAAVSNAAGDGLVVGQDETLDVDVDPTTLTIDSNKLKVVASGLVDDATVEASTNKIRIKDGGVDTAKLADQGVTPMKMSARVSKTDGTDPGAWGVSSNAANASGIGTSFQDVATCTLTVVGGHGPVVCQVTGDGSDTGTPSNLSANAEVRILRDSTVLTTMQGGIGFGPVSKIRHEEVMPAGQYTFKLQVMATSGTTALLRSRFLVFEQL